MIFAERSADKFAFRVIDPLLAIFKCSFPVTLTFDFLTSNLHPLLHMSRVIPPSDFKPLLSDIIIIIIIII